MPVARAWAGSEYTCAPAGGQELRIPMKTPASWSITALRAINAALGALRW
jgi:hypothetical protein